MMDPSEWVFDSLKADMIEINTAEGPGRIVLPVLF
jgi:hypothetical protein